ncbi:MAG: signaling protein, partial [Rubripirellula sp.]
LLAVLSQSGRSPLELKLVRNQQVIKLSFTPTVFVLTDSAATPALAKIPVPASSAWNVVANQKTNNDPLTSLTDGKLATGYGPVFGNGVNNGAYKMDLGAVTPLAAISNWSHSRNGQRGAQNVTLYGSEALSDPGWNLSKYTPLGTIDTTAQQLNAYNAVSLRASAGKSLGSFRWIVWAVSPVSSKAGGENTAFQELHVEAIIDTDSDGQ